MESGHDHTCRCAFGVPIPHLVSTDGCCRDMVTAPEKLQNDFWLVDGATITGYSLREQRGYYQHSCGCWSRPREQGSENSITA